MKLDNKIVIYQTEDGKTQLDVKLENETVWLTQAQMVQLFDSSKANVSEHIKHIYEDGELAADSTVRKFRTVQTEGKRQVGRNVTYYNLDLIISLGYRVNTKRGIQFRSMARTVKLQDLSKEVRSALLDVVVDYTFALDRLDDYDYQRLSIPESSTEEKFHATYEGAMKVLAELRDKFGGSGLFANEKDDSFKSSIGQIYQTFGGQDLYPTVEEKAAMLLYLVTKNHSFSDGNKRIAATLFLWFMNENGILYDDMHNKRIDDATLVALTLLLVALTLLIAESRPEEKDTMIKVVVNLIGHAK